MSEGSCDGDLLASALFDTEELSAAEGEMVADLLSVLLVVEDGEWVPRELDSDSVEPERLWVKDKLANLVADSERVPIMDLERDRDRCCDSDGEEETDLSAEGDNDVVRLKLTLTDTLERLLVSESDRVMLSVGVIVRERLTVALAEREGAKVDVAVLVPCEKESVTDSVCDKVSSKEMDGVGPIVADGVISTDGVVVMEASRDSDVEFVSVWERDTSGVNDTDWDPMLVTLRVAVDDDDTVKVGDQGV